MTAVEDFDLSCVMIQRLKVEEGGGRPPLPDWDRPWRKLDFNAHPPEKITWEEFVERFCPNGYRGEFYNVNHLQVGDLVGLVEPKDGGPLTNFLGGATSQGSGLYVVLPDDIVERWREVYQVLYISPTRERVPLPPELLVE